MMYLIISPIKIENLQKYHYQADGKMSFEEYSKTSEGEEFFSITPLIIDLIPDKKTLVYQISMDISWLSLCYNIPLYIYIMSDNWYYKNLHLYNLRSRRNFGKCTQMTNKHHLEGYALDSFEVQSFRVPQDSSYYNGDMELIEKEVSKIVLDKSFNLKKNPIQCVRLTARDGLKLI